MGFITEDFGSAGVRVRNVPLVLLGRRASVDHLFALLLDVNDEEGLFVRFFVSEFQTSDFLAFLRLHFDRSFRPDRFETNPLFVAFNLLMPDLLV